MNKSVTSTLAAIAIALATASPAGANDLIQNGNFSTGLSNWTSYNTSNGQTNTTTNNFDVAGSGAGPTLRMQVGVVAFPGFDGPQEGGGVLQNISLLSSGIYNFKADVASQTYSEFNNGAGGLFSLLINGSPVTSFDAGFIPGFSIVRSSMAFSGYLLAGTHSFGVQATRAYTPGAVYQYASNVSLQSAAVAGVPEPASWALMIGGFGIVGGAMRRRAVRTTAASV